MANEVRFQNRVSAIEERAVRGANRLRRWRRFVVVVYGVCVIAVLVLSAQTDQSNPKGKTEVDQLREMVTMYRNDLGRVQQLLLLLAGLGTFYALVQGAFAYLTVEHFSRRAKELFDEHKTDLKESRDDLKATKAALEEEVRKEMEASRRHLEERINKVEADAEKEVAHFTKRILDQHPLLDEFAGGLQRISSEVARICRRVGLDRTRFSRLQPEERHTIEYFEQAMPFLEHVGRTGPIDSSWTLLQFSTYHFSKAIWLEAQPQLKREAELNRSLSSYYFDRAETLQARDYRVLAEKGYRKMLEGSIAESRDLFLQSLDSHPDQRCSMYCLAWLDDEVGQLQNARDWLNKALKVDYWFFRGDGLEARCSSVPYNLACCLSKMAGQAGGTPEAEELLKEAFRALAVAMQFPKEREPSFRKDASGGELKILAEHSAYKAEIEDYLRLVYG